MGNKSFTSKEIPWRQETNENGSRPEVRPIRNPLTIQTCSQLRQALSMDFGIQSADQLSELNIHSWDELMISPAMAYKQIAASREES